MLAEASTDAEQARLHNDDIGLGQAPQCITKIRQAHLCTYP